MIIFEEAILFLGWLRDLLEIYTWPEVWMVASVPISITAVWFLFAFLLGVQNDAVRAVAIWSLIIILTLGAVTTDYLRKHQK